MSITILIKRGTRANLDTLAGSSSLNIGELYFVTDEDVLAVGTSTSTYEDIGPSTGLSDVVDDTTPQLGGTLDANGFDIDMGANHLICDQRIVEHDGDSDTYLEFSTTDWLRCVTGGIVIFDASPTVFSVYRDIDLGLNHLICGQRIAEHDGDSDTYMEFDGANQWALTLGGTQILDASSLALTVNGNVQLTGNSVLVDEEIARHNADSDTHIDFPGSDQWSVTVGGTSMLEVGTSGVDIDGYCLYRADITDDSGTGTTAISTANSGQTRRATHSSGTRTYRLDSATVGTQVQFIRDGAGDVTFSAGTSQTVQSTKGTTPQITAQYGMAYAVCVATNQWRVSGDIEP